MPAIEPLLSLSGIYMYVNEYCNVLARMADMENHPTHCLSSVQLTVIILVSVPFVFKPCFFNNIDQVSGL